MYSTYEEECEANRRTSKDHGSRRRPEPHRPGQSSSTIAASCRHGHAEDGYETIMVNCNPETVSTDYDTSTASISSR